MLLFNKLIHNKYFKSFICILLVVTILINLPIKSDAVVAEALIFSVGGAPLLAFALALLAVGITVTTIDELLELNRLFTAESVESQYNPDMDPKKPEFDIKDLIKGVIGGGILGYGNLLSKKIKTGQVVDDKKYPNGFRLEGGSLVLPSNISTGYLPNFPTSFLPSSSVKYNRSIKGEYGKRLVKYLVVFYPYGDTSTLLDVSSEWGPYDGVVLEQSKCSFIWNLYAIKDTDTKNKYLLKMKAIQNGVMTESELIFNSYVPKNTIPSHLYKVKPSSPFDEGVEAVKDLQPNLKHVLGKLDILEEKQLENGKFQLKVQGGLDNIYNKLGQVTTLDNLRPSEETYTIIEKDGETIITYDTKPGVDGLPGADGQDGQPGADAKSNYDEDSLIGKLTKMFTSLWMPKPDYLKEKMTAIETKINLKLNIPTGTAITGVLGGLKCEPIPDQYFKDDKIIDFKYLNDNAPVIASWQRYFWYVVLLLLGLNNIYKLIRGNNLINVKEGGD